MRILYVCAVDLGRQFAGTTHVVETVRNLRKRGHQVYLLAMCHRLPAKWNDLGDHTYLVPVSRVPVLRPFAFHILLAFYVGFLLLRYGADVVYEREAPFALGVRLPALLLGIPRVLEINGLPGDEENVVASQRPRNKLRAAFLRLDLRAASAIVVVSEQMRSAIIRRYAIPPNRIHVVLNGVNEEHFHPRDVIECRQELGLRIERKLVCYVGSFQPYHGLDLLAEAAGAIVDKTTDVRFVLVGDGPERPAYEEEIRKAGLSQYFHFTREVPYALVPVYICACDICVFVYTPFHEGHVSPLKLFEYMACGKPVLAATGSSSLLGIPKGAAATGAFMSIERVTAASLADGIVGLLSGTAMAAEMGKRGRELVLSGHTWSHVAARIEKILFSVRRHRAAGRMAV